VESVESVERTSSRGLRICLFLFFVLSGFAGLLYQIVWIRMALASFGVITPFASVVVSVFMLGLALGSWLGGRWAAPLADRLGLSPILLYGAAELGIGVGAFALPWLFDTGRELLLPIGGMGSNEYLLLSSLWITVAMLPWCLCMGATYPTMMAFIERIEADPAGSFSYLYLANVIGAMVGTVATSVVLIELLGFRDSLSVAAILNGSVALGCIAIAALRPALPRQAGSWAPRLPLATEPRTRAGRHATLILFTTGFTSMALEIVWIRAFTPVLGTLVYAFSGLLGSYLLATWLGSGLYRLHRRRGRPLSLRALFCWLAPASLLPVWIAMPRNLVAGSEWLLPLLAGLGDLRLGFASVSLSLLSILPFCAGLGYLTPMLIDEHARGRPEHAGRAYAVNIAGSIVGPLAAAYWLLPWLGSRLSMLALAIPFVVFFALECLRPAPWRARSVFGVVAGLLVALGVQTGLHGHSYEEGSHLRNAVVRRDHTATVISYGHAFDRRLLVNGYGMTVLTPLTKVMAHLPLASLDHDPERALVIAFGMGTTFRSLLSWGLETTAVELVPSVIDAFDYYHADAAAIRGNPRAEIVVDDGRRYLARTSERFDLITLDPPPPVETAGSSLLYAEEFYELAKARLAEGGILHQWFPDGAFVEPAIRDAVLRSIARAFPHVRIFRSLHGQGLHVLCSLHPVVVPEADAFVARLPDAARRDLMEWEPAGASLRDFVAQQILSKEIALDQLLREPAGPTITDDRPFNEYFALRRLREALGL